MPLPLSHCLRLASLLLLGCCLRLGLRGRRGHRQRRGRGLWLSDRHGLLHPPQSSPGSWPRRESCRLLAGSTAVVCSCLAKWAPLLLSTDERQPVQPVSVQPPKKLFWHSLRKVERKALKCSKTASVVCKHRCWVRHMILAHWRACSEFLGSANHSK